ncbi:hypothetical protein LINPERPRIM_LOCUS13421 [Linum perenne]
MCLQATTRSAK